jgi:2-desacetyl-2-hydroxyethyl bacteriochlorophyllide A dehydrogenase
MTVTDTSAPTPTPTLSPRVPTLPIVTIEPWHESIDAVVAGSLFAVETRMRLAAASALSATGCAIHLDFIIDDRGQHLGVHPDELSALLTLTSPLTPIDVHVMCTVGADKISEPAKLEAQRVLSSLVGKRVSHVTVSRSTFIDQPQLIRRLQDSSVPVWVDLPPGDLARDLPVSADGVLVMLISPGTVAEANPACLDQVPALAQSWTVGVDGGITAALAIAAVTAGAQFVVSGRALLTPITDIHETIGINEITEIGEVMTSILPTTMRTSVLSGQRALTIEERDVPTPAAGDVLVHVAAVGVCGSDVHYFRHGRIGDFVVDGPLVLGHELSGTIVAVGDGVDEARVGQRVAIEPQKPCHRCRECRSGHYNLCPDMEFFATPPIDGAFTGYITIESEFAHAVPDSMSDEAAALLEPLSVAITAMRKAHVVPGSRVLIAGAGPIGIICAQTAKAFGAAEIIVSDLVPERRERALTFGATSVIDPAVIDIANAGLDVDAFIDASGAPRAVFAGIKAVRPAGYAVLVGLGNPEMNLPIEHIQNKEVWVTGIFRYTDTWPAGIHLVTSGQVDLDSLVTGRFDLDHVEDALESDLDPANLKSIVYPNK